MGFFDTLRKKKDKEALATRQKNEAVCAEPGGDGTLVRGEKAAVPGEVSAQ